MHNQEILALREAIPIRHSRRTYLEQPIKTALAKRLEEALAEYAAQGSVDMRMVLDNSTAWNGVKNSYGMFSGVQNYVGLIARADDTAAFERLGYYGEAWVLQAAAHDLGTCWVASSFSRDACPFELRDNEEIICAISFGPVAEAFSGREKLIKRFTSRKSKTTEEMISKESDEIPDWFRCGMEMVQKAPSAVNRQPVVFSYKDGIASASVPDVTDKTMALDFGIAKLHFEIGAGGGTWDWGNNGVFHRRTE